jgi:hypothetical protein
MDSQLRQARLLFCLKLLTFGALPIAGCPQFLLPSDQLVESAPQAPAEDQESLDMPAIESDEEITFIADGGTIVLGDAGVWQVSTPDFADAHRAESWHRGEDVTLRVFGFLSLWDEIHNVVSGEVVHSSGEAPVDVTLIGYAEEVVVTEIGDDDTVHFSNGFTSSLLKSHAVSWEIGDRVLLIGGALRGEWYIHVETADFIAFSLVY